MAGDRPSQEGRNEPEYLNPRLTLRWPHPPLFSYWIGWRSCPPNVSLRPRVVTHPGMTASKRRRWEKPTIAEELCLISWGECRTKALEVTGESDRLQVKKGWNWRDLSGLIPLHFSHYVNSSRLSVDPGDPLPRRSSP